MIEDQSFGRCQVVRYRENMARAEWRCLRCGFENRLPLSSFASYDRFLCLSCGKEEVAFRYVVTPEADQPRTES